MKTIKYFFLTSVALLSFSIEGTAQAKPISSRCDIYPKGDDRSTKVVNCTYEQKSNGITITRSDGIKYQLKGKDNKYTDQYGKSASRQTDGSIIILRLNKESVYVYQGEKAPNTSKH